MADRPNRRQPKVSAAVVAAKAGAERLRAARAGGAGQGLATLQVKQEDRIYDEVGEAEYEKRREDTGNFIAKDEDDDMPYEDDDLFTPRPASEDGSDREDAGGKGGKKRKGPISNKEVGRGCKRRAGDSAPIVPPAGRITSLLAKASKQAATAAPRAAVTDASSDDVLLDILGGLGGDVPAAPLAGVLGRPTAPVVAGCAAVGPLKTFSRNPARGSAAVAPASKLGKSHSFAAAEEAAVGRPGLSGSAPALPLRPVLPLVQEDLPEHDNGPDDNGTGTGAEETDAAAAVIEGSGRQSMGSIKMETDDGPAPLPPCPSEEKAHKAATHPHSRMFADVPKSDADKASRPVRGWQEMMDGSVEPEEGEVARGGADGVNAVETAAMAAAGADAGAAAAVGAGLELDSAGCLPFFFLDAYEMEARPGEVFLFGKVHQAGRWQSCCAAVRGLQRSLFVVPQDGVFANCSPEKEEQRVHLEAEAAADPSMRLALIKHLQECCSEVKNELRSILSGPGLHIKKHRVAIVQRNYAFEDPQVAHGKQYVLKVRYPANLPTLPLGTRGKTFRAIFGAQQSSLEALLLKRHIRGPGWLLLKAPVKVDYVNQVSWCKIEVSLEGSKGILCSPPPGAAATPAAAAAVAASKAKLSQAEAAALAALAGRPSPPLTVVSLHLTTLISPKSHQHEVAAVNVVHLGTASADAPTDLRRLRAVHSFNVVRRLDNQPWPTDFEGLLEAENQKHLGRTSEGLMYMAQASERTLLTTLLARLQAIDADVLVGHNIAAFDLTVLLQRMQHHKVPHWSRIGRMKRREVPKISGGGHSFGGGAGAAVMGTVAGRLLADTYLSARELVRSVDYTLRTLCETLLNQSRSELTASDVPRMYGSGQDLVKMLQHGSSDAWLALGLMFHLSVLPLSKQLSNLSGSLWGRTLAGQRAQRIEMLLLHEFHGRKFILPDKLTLKDKDRLRAQREHEEEANGGEEDGDEPPGGKRSVGGVATKGPQYAGGLVLEPKKGLYDKLVVLLDFNSLYPSIIQEFNICFTTVQRPKDGGMPPLPETSACGLAPLPTVIQGLVNKRKEVKHKMKGARDPVQKEQLNIQQQAIKLTANSMYGCLGFGNSRFFAKPLAELITSQGRSILQSTVDLVQGVIGADVIYGDTDSIMIYTGTEDVSQAFELANRVKREVNRRYKLLEIEQDGLFKCMLLLKKKKYAAIKLEPGPDGILKEVTERKGLDMVRRDWSPLCKDIGNHVLDLLLSGQPREVVVSDIHAVLRQARESILSGQVPLDKFIITKQLTKRPEEYPDAKGQPHVQVALRRKEAGKPAFLPGETVPYIICVERPDQTPPTTPAPDTAAGAGPGQEGQGAPAATPSGFQVSSCAAAAVVTPDKTTASATTAAAGVTPCEAPAAPRERAGAITPTGSRSGGGAKGGSGGLADRAHHPDELHENPRLAIDVDYYLANQVHPVVARLVAPLEGTDAAHVADCLGLDSGRFRGPAGGGDAVEEELLAASGSMLDDDENFKACEPLMLLAPNRTQFEFKGVDAVLRGVLPAECLLTPPNALGDPTATLSGTQLCNQVLLRVRSAINSYYEGELVSDDGSLTSRNVCLAVSGEPERSLHPDPARRGVTLGRRITERQLWLQLSHFYRLLDVDSALKRTHAQMQAAAGPKVRVLEADLSARVAPIRLALTAAAAVVASKIASSGYNWVDLGQLFTPLRKEAGCAY